MKRAFATELKTVTQKSLDVNRRAVRAYVIPFNKEEGDRDINAVSKALPEDPWREYTENGQLVEPPLDPLFLTTLQEMSTEMIPAIDAMSQNIEGFGYRLVSRVKLEDPRVNEQMRTEIEEERVRLENFFNYASLECSFVQLRKMRRADYELTGMAYWEVLRNVNGEIQGFEHIPSYQMRLGAQDKDPVQVEIPVLWKIAGGAFEIRNITAWKRFRKLCHHKEGKYRWFKSWGDPRVYDNETGECMSAEQVSNWRGTGEPMPFCRRANDMVFWRRYVPRTPYGLPRYVGALLCVLGDRGAEEINFTTWENNNLPAVLLAVSNGQLTEGTIERINTFVEGRRQHNRNGFLILEAEGQYEGEDSGQVKIDVKELKDARSDDALFQNYSKSNQEKIRKAWRIPPVFLGMVEDYSRASAETSRRLGDEQVFAPEREDFDDWINRRLFPAMGVRYHRYKSNSPNTTDNTELVRILSGAEKTGGMTPRIARSLLEDILSSQLPDFPEGFPADLPFSMTMAEAVKNKADPTEVGQQVTALKGDGADFVERILNIRRRLEEEWERDVLGLEVELEELEELLD